MKLQDEQKKDVQIFISCLDYLYRESLKSNMDAVSQILARAQHDLHQWMTSGSPVANGTLTEILDKDFLQVYTFFHTLLLASKEDIQNLVAYMERNECITQH